MRAFAAGACAFAVAARVLPAAPCPFPAAARLAAGRLFGSAGGTALRGTRTVAAAVWDNLRMTTRAKLLSFIFLCAIAVAGFAVTVMRPHSAPAVDLTTGTFLARSRELPDFSLIDQQGRGFDRASLRGHWSLLFFGYTHCPDFCPTTLATLAAVQKGLRAAGAAALPQVIFVSVDAQRDSPEQMAQYVHSFDPEFIGLTAADQPSIEAVAKKLGLGVAIQPASDGNYTVDHSGAIFVLSPDGRITAILTGPFGVNALQGDFQRILAARGFAAGRA